MAEAGQPIIIKRIKKAGHAHHGGAWKVAFADFVTAMMAFFLLLWLLGSTTPEQKKGISDYFVNPSGVAASGGASNAAVDMGGGMDSPSGKGENPDELHPDVKIPAPEQSEQQTLDYEDEKSIEEQAKELEKKKLESLLEELKEAIEKGQELKPFKDQLLLDITSEGLRIQIVDKENRPMFDSGSSTLKNYTSDILRGIVKVINRVPNKISLSGHTDRTPFSGNRGYTNWELSADRANAARRELVAGGVPEDRIARVVGLGSSVLFDKVNSFNPINRRISIIVMNKATEDDLNKEGASPSAPSDPVLSAPGKDDPQETPVPDAPSGGSKEDTVLQSPAIPAEGAAPSAQDAPGPDVAVPAAAPPLDAPANVP